MKKFLLLALVLFSGCVGQVPIDKYVSAGCVRACEHFDGNMSDGPCLTNEIFKDWVCDIAHNPRLPIDDLEENQCESFLNGEANHFVEVTPTCELIKVQ
ncbi:MAG: hypothetical protein GON13_00365 [Nanoarchaeota archaeon]|nr:hypothetical protein [Nanoarchaeota archaeon]